MSRFNTSGHRAKEAVEIVTSPMGTSTGRPDGRTFQGARAWKKTPKTDLFLRASASFADGKDTFYESGEKRDETLRQLAAQVAVEDPVWFGDFLLWLRRTANIRTAAIMAACDGVKARLDAEKQGKLSNPQAAGDHAFVVLHYNRRFIDSVLYRADEPGELLAYWTATYGRKIPKPVKRGVADAVRRLYNGKSLLKYDTTSHAFRFGDVLNVVHAEPHPDKPWQGDLFRYALDRRHNPDTAVPPESNRTLMARKALMELPVARRREVLLAPDGAERLAEASMTWEALAGWLQGPMDKSAWEAVIPSMGYMALLRNLRNFDEADVSNKVAGRVIAQLTDEEQVANSRQLPFRFYSAYKAAPSLRWAQALETALDLCLPNIPDLPGQTLVLVDTSGSMSMYENNGSGRRTYDSSARGLNCLNVAALFGAALATRAPDRTTLVTFDTNSRVVAVPRGGSVLKLTDQILGLPHGGATYTQQAIQRHYDKHDRVIILTDEQSHMHGYADAAATVPDHVPVYSFCLVGYSGTPMPTGEKARFQLGGLSDQTFKLIPLLEQGDGCWPWETGQ